MRARTLLTLLASLTLALSFGLLRAHAQPSQDALIKAWEEVQKNDPETVTFEKTGEGRYKFKTNRFPFDGELRILKVLVNDALAEYESGFAMGVVEHDLVGLSEEVRRKYERSYSNWQATNTLYFDKETNEWLSSREHQARFRAKYEAEMKSHEAQEQQQEQSKRWLSFALTWLPLIVLFFFWVWLLNRMGIKRQRDYMNRALMHMERVEATLERIALAAEKNGKTQG